MFNLKLVRRMGGILMVLAVICLSPRLAAAACRDNDGDGYGRSCALGPDCDDSNPNIHPGAQEACNGVDDDCNGLVDENLLDAGQFCHTGQLGRCDTGRTQCVSGAMQCVAVQGPTSETCNGIDDDCNGLVDDGPGTDADGDGYTTFCDCNDSNPSIHPAAVDLCGDGIDQDCNGNVDNMTTDSSGKLYCLEMDPVSGVAGQATPVTIRAYYQDGIYSIKLIQEGDTVNQNQEHLCGGQTNCTFSTSITQPYQGQRYLTTDLYKTMFGFVAEKSLSADFVCSSEYCPPDPRIDGLMSWMRGKGYAECVSSKYLERSIDGQEKSILRDFLEERPSGITQPLTVDFYDVVPTDPEATYRSLGAGEGGNCQADPNWPVFCPSPVPADYRFAEQHYERTFGIDVNFVYHRLNIDYSQTFGDPVLVSLGGSNYYRFPGDRYSFISQFADHSIVHYAIQTWQNPGDPAPLYTTDMTGGGTLEEISLEPFNAFGAETYTHEWGHTWGLPHPFYTDPLGARVFVTLDGIMDNTYRANTRLVDPLDPLERYALEPSGSAYRDDSTFAATYNAGIIGSFLLPACGTVDPAITSGRLVLETSTDYVFELTLTNNGTIPVGYVPLRVTGSSQPGVIFADRIIERLKPGETKIHDVTLSKSVFTSYNAIFTLDPGNVIAETNEVNNQVSVAPCPDADGDGYRVCVDDCNDANAAIHPGAAEVCNGVDDNCNGSVDEGFDADHDGWTTCAGDCHDDDPRVNGVESVAGNYASCFDGLDNDCDGVVDWDCASDVSNEQVALGTATGGLASMTAGSADDVYESLKESNSGKRLLAYWTFPGVSPSFWYELRVEGFRSSSTGDSFNFSWTTKQQTLGPCNGTETNYQPALSVIKTVDDDRMQVFQLGPPPAGEGAVEFCVKAEDSNPASSDKSADTLKLDKLYVFPILLDARAQSETTAIGTRLNGTSYLQTQSADGTDEIIQEAGADALDQTWKLTVPVGYEHRLYVDGWRTSSTDLDDFQFYYATPIPNVIPEQPGTFQLIPGALVNQSRGGTVFNVLFGAPNLVGTVWIKAMDTVPNGATLDKLHVDYLAVKTAN
jgi:putative metal-binding protein/CARDB protein